MVNQFQKISKVLVLIILTLFLVQFSNAATFRSGCASYADNGLESCSWSYGGQNFNYVANGAVPQTNVAENSFFNILYSASGHVPEYFSVFIDSRALTAECLDANGCNVVNGDWRTYCYDNGWGWHVCYMYNNGNEVNFYHVEDATQKVTFVPHLTPGSNSAPVFEGENSYSFDEDSGAQNNIIDLYEIVADDRDSDSALAFSVVSQTNSGLTNCVLDSNRYIDCSAPAANQFGTNTIRIRATDSLGASRNKNINIVVNSVNDAPSTPTSLSFNSGVYGNGNNTVSLTCAGSTDIDSTVYYNIESNITGSWIQIVSDDSDGIYDFDISSYGSRTGIGFRCQATDLINQSSYFTSVNTIDIDDTVPAVFDLIANNIEFGSDNEILVNVTDSTSVSSVILEVNSANNYTMTVKSGNTYNYSFVNPAIGTYNLRIYAKDNYNNINSSVVGSYIVSDTTNPSVFGLIDNHPVEYDGNVIVNVNVTDLSLANVWIEINGSNQSMNNIGGDEFKLNLSGLNVGVYGYTIYANDSQGNLNDSVTGSVTVQDTVAPKWAPVPVNQTIELGSIFSYDVNATDLQTIVYSINDTVNFVIDSNTGLIRNATSLNIGLYQLELNASDGTNVNTTYINVTVQDTVAPKWTPVPVNQIIEFGSIFSYDVNAIDLQTIVYSINDTVNFVIDSNTGLITNATNLDIGLYQLELNASDGTNMNKTYINVTIQDTMAPVWSPIPANQINELGSAFNYDVNATDLRNVIYSINDSVNFKINSSSGILENNTALTVGVYQLELNASDGTNDNLTYINISVKDTIIPQVFGLQTPSVEFNGDLTIRVNATDLSGISKVILEVDNTTNYTMIVESGNMYNYTLTSPSVGGHNIQIYVNDSQGNRNDSVIGSFVVTDTTNPSVFGLIDNHPVEYDGNVIVNVNVTDLSLANVWIEINGSNQSMNNIGGDEFKLNLSGLNVGVYGYTIYANDSQGNLNDSVTGSVTVQDTVAPKWAPVPVNQTIELGSIFSYDVNATDLQTITYSVNDTTNFAIDSNTGLITNATSLNVGLYQLELNASDGTNVNTTYINVTIQDTTSPLLFDLVGDDVEYDDNVTFSVNVTDLSSINSVWLVLNNGSNYSLSNTAGNTYQYEFDSPTVGTYSFVIYANDSYSNLANITGSFTAEDTTKPSVFGLNASSPVELGNNLTIQVNVTDLTLDTVWILINGSNQTLNNPIVDIYNISLDGFGVGNYPFTIYANDSQNNLNDSVFGTIVVNDTTKPSVFGLEFNTSVEYDANVKFYVNVTDLSTISEVKLEYNNSNLSMTKLTDNQYNYTLVSPLVGNNQAFTIYAIDSSGNINGSVSGVFNATDLTAPKWNPIPTNQAIELGSIFSYDVNATDLRGVVYSINDTTNFEIDFNTGLITNKTGLNIGLYQLELNASDSTNANITYINVTVGDTIAPKWTPIPVNQIIELGSAFNYDVNATDLRTIIYTINDTTNFEINSSTGLITNKTGLNIGVYQLELNASDDANVNKTYINVTVEDTVAPVWSPIPVNQVEEYGNNFSYIVSAIDLQSVTYSVNDTVNFVINSTGGISNVTPLDVGLYQLELNASDGTNMNKTYINVTIQDTVAPVWSPVPTNQTIELGTIFSYDINATDLRNVIYSVNDSTNFVINSNTGLITNATSLSVGLYQLELNASDGVNNNLTYINVSVEDTIVPSVFGLSVNNTVEYDANVEFYVNVTDLSTISEVKLEYNNSNLSMTKLTGNQYNYTLVSPLVGNNQAFTIYAIDSSGNVNGTVSGTFDVTDLTKPSVSNVQTNTPVEYNGNAYINVTVIDLNLANVWILINGSNQTMTVLGSNIFNLTVSGLDVGSYPFTVYANDTFNNLNGSVSSILYVNDTTSPLLFDLVGDDVEYDGNVTFSVNVTDLSSINSVWLVLNNGSNYSLSNTAGNTYQYELDSPTVGTYSFVIYANDSYSNLANITGSFTARDTTKPSVFGLNAPTPVEFGNNITIQVNVTDLTLDSVWILINGSNQTLNNPIVDIYNISLDGFGVGNYPFTIYANDSQNNLNDSVFGTIVVNDTTKPAVFGLDYNTSVEYDASVEFYVNVTDLSIISEVKLEYNNSNLSMTKLTGNQYNYTLVSPLVGNNQAFTIYAIDSSGNVNGTVSGTFNVTDLTKPAVFGLNTNSPIEYDGDVNITVNATDLNLANVWVEINGSNQTMTDLGGNIFNIIISGLDIATYPFTVYANDTFGNLNNTVSDSVIVRDITVPQVTSLIANNVEFNNDNIINVTVSDISGVESVILEVSGVDPIQNYTMSNNSLTNYNVTLNSPSVGTHSLRVYVNDTQGNRNDSVIGTFEVTEITPPSVTGLIDNSPVEYNGDVLFNVTVSDLSIIDSVWVNINNGNHSLSNTSLTDYNLTLSGLGFGNYPYIIYANDSYGNLNDSVTGTIIVNDSIVPSVFDLVLSNVEYDGNLTIKVNATDLSNIATVILEVSGVDPIQNYTMNDEANNRYNYTLISPSVGTHNVKIYVNDTRGNRNDSITGTFDVTDNTAPKWTPIPSNQTIELGNSFSYVVVATDLRTVIYSINDTTNFAINSSSGLITNATNLGVGLYQLELNASDSVNDNLTYINVSVEDTTAPVWSPMPTNQVIELGSDFSYDTSAIDLQTIVYSINNSVNFAINSSTGLITNKTELNIGVYQLELNATDVSGNVNSTFINVTVGDNTAPVWSPIPLNQTVELGNSFSYDVNASDLSSVIYSINDTTNFTINSSSGLITNVTNLSVGLYQLELNASDGANNNLTYINVSVEDTIVPSVFGLDYVKTVEYNNNLTVYVNVTDLSGIATVLLDYKTNTYVMHDEGNGRFNVTIESPDVGNVQIFEITARDNYMNTNASVNGTFNVTDSVAPKWNLIPLNQTVELGNSFSYDVNASDLSSVIYSVNDTTNFAINSSSGLITNTTNLGVGLYQLELNASDSINGNLTYINVSVIDTTVPQVTNSQIPLTVFSNQTFNVTVEVFDFSNIDSVLVGINNGSNEINYSMSTIDNSLYNLTLTNYTAGNYNVIYYVNDSYNNRNDSIIDSFTVVASNTAPSIISFIPNSGSFNEGDLLNVTVIATDSDSTPLIRLYRNSTQVAWTSTGTLNYLYTFNNTEEGSYNFTACSEDGIETSCATRIYTVLDKAIPDLSNVTPTGTVYGSSQSIVIYPDRNIDNTTFILDINGNDVTGSASATQTNITYDATNLPQGINTVNVTATDLVGNTQSYNWTFSVDLTSQVTGFVLDDSNNGLGSANVAIAYASNGTSIGNTNTYVSGSWINSFDLEEGVYTFTVTAPNYVTNITNISIDGTDQEINFTLFEKPNIRIDSLTHVPAFEVEYQDVTFTTNLTYEGKFNDNVNLSLFKDGIYLVSKNVTIDKDNSSYSVDLVWTNATVGTFDFTANVSSLEKETYMADNEAYENEIDVVPIEDVLSLGIRNVPSFNLTAMNLTGWNVYTDVVSSASVDLINIPLEFVAGPGITLNTVPNNVVFNISNGSTKTHTWNIDLKINSSGTLSYSNVTASIYSDIVLSKNFTAHTGVGIVN